MSENQDSTSNHQTASTPAFDPLGWAEKDREHTRRMNELLPLNKATLFDALVIVGITLVTVDFNGSGDEGLMEDVFVQVGDAPGDLPEDGIEILDLMWGGTETERQTMTVSEAIKTLAWNILRKTYGFWEDGEGAFGQFIFNVSERTIRLEYNERIIDTEYFEHEF